MKKILKYKVFNYSTFDKGLAGDKNPNMSKIGSAEKCYNFSYKDGGLTDGLGVSNILYYPYGSDLLTAFEFPTTISPIKITQFPFYNKGMDYRDRMIIFVTDSNQVYGWKPNKTSEGLLLFPFDVDGKAIFLNYVFDNETYIYAITDSKMYIYNVDKGVLETISENVPRFEDVCFYNNNVFAISKDNKHSVWYSNQENPINWLENKKLYNYMDFNDLQGNCLKLMSTNAGIYLFREYGISKIVFNEKEEMYQVDDVYISPSKIYQNSIHECGEDFVFMTTDGMYVFNGITSRKVCTNIEKLIKSSFTNFSLTAYHDGFYYIGLKTVYSDNLNIGDDDYNCTTNTLIRIDLQDMTESIMRGVDIVDIKRINEVNSSFLFTIVRVGEVNRVGLITENGCVFDQVTKKYWKSVDSDFDLSGKKKILTRLFIVSKSDVKLILSGDGKKYSYDLAGSENIQIIKPNISAYRFGVEIVSESNNNDITNISAMVGYYE